MSFVTPATRVSTRTKEHLEHRVREVSLLNILILKVSAKRKTVGGRQLVMKIVNNKLDFNNFNENVVVALTALFPLKIFLWLIFLFIE